VNEETFGDALKRWRETRQLSVRGLAALAHYGKSHISGLENGRLARPEVAKHLDEILQAGGELVALAEAERITQQLRGDEGNRFAAHYYAHLAQQLLSGPEGWNDMRRRTFLFGAGGVAGLGLAAPALALETARHGLTFALAEQRADVSVHEWQEIVTEYGYSYQTTPPAELIELLVVDVLGIQYAIDQQLAASGSGATLRELRRAGALLAALMAMTVANLGQMHHAARWWRTARSVAEQSGDVETVTWIRGREVVRALYERRPLNYILRLTDKAEAYSDGAPARALPELVSGKAQALALAGRADDATATLHRLQSIYETLPSEATADRATVFSWADDRLRFTESFVYSHLGDVRKATIAQDQALAVYPSEYRRGPAQIELQRALCLVRSNDIQGGMQHAQAVVAGLSPAEHIRPIFDLSRRVLDAVPLPHRSHTHVTELRDFVAEIDAPTVS
jgi:transcriptional regulator with XRE-family HTH domain